MRALTTISTLILLGTLCAFDVGAVSRKDAEATLTSFDEAMMRFDIHSLESLLASDAEVSVTNCRKAETVQSSAEFVRMVEGMEAHVTDYRRTRRAIQPAARVSEALQLESEVHESMTLRSAGSNSGWSTEATTFGVGPSGVIITAIRSVMACP